MTVTEVKERGKVWRHPMIEFGEKVIQVLEQSAKSNDPRIPRLTEEHDEAISRFEMAETKLEKWDEGNRLEEKTRSLYSILAGEESPIVQNIGQDLGVVAGLYRGLALAKAEGRSEKEELSRSRREDKEEWDDDWYGDLIDELKANGVWPWKD